MLIPKVNSYADCFLMMRIRNVISLLNYGKGHWIMHAALRCQLLFLSPTPNDAWSLIFKLDASKIDLNVLCVHGHWC